MTSDTSAISLPSPDHIGIVVKDIDKTAEALSSTWGIGPWRIEEYSLQKEDMMVGEPFRNKAAKVKLGATELHLIQPLEGRRSITAQFLKTKGEGLHHISFTIPNWDETRSKLRQQGVRMVAGGLLNGKRWAYFETKPGGIIIELGEKP